MNQISILSPEEAHRFAAEERIRADLLRRQARRYRDIADSREHWAGLADLNARNWELAARGRFFESEIDIHALPPITLASRPVSRLAAVRQRLSDASRTAWLTFGALTQKKPSRGSRLLG